MKIQNRNSLIDTENQLMVAKKEGAMGMGIKKNKITKYLNLMSKIFISF